MCCGRQPIKSRPCTPVRSALTAPNMSHFSWQYYGQEHGKSINYECDGAGSKPLVITTTINNKIGKEIKKKKTNARSCLSQTDLEAPAPVHT